MTVILGGGICGLSAGYYALKHQQLAPLVILEASNRVGGWIRSKVLDDGTVFEQGPHTIRLTSGNETLELLNGLGLSDRITGMGPTHPASRNRWIYANNELHLLPTSFRGALKKHPLFGRLIVNGLWNDLRAPKCLTKDESLYSFTKRRFGKEIADYVISSAVRGICAGDSEKISVNFMFKRLFEYEQKYGSVTKGFLKSLFSSYDKDMEELLEKRKTQVPNELDKKSEKEKWMFLTIKGGLEQFPCTLADKLQKRGVNIKLGEKCEKITFKSDHAELVVNGERRKHSRVVSCLPAKNLADLVQEQHPQLSNELREIPSVTVAVVNLQFSGNVLPMDAFGFLVPPKEDSPILGVIFASSLYTQNSTVLTVMMGGAWYEKYFGENTGSEELLTVAVNEVKKILSIKDDPKASNVSILKDCIPQLNVGYEERLNRIHDYISAHRIPLALCGSYEGVGINQVILSAKQAVSNIVKDTKV